jgi:hypothetical protein
MRGNEIDLRIAKGYAQNEPGRSDQGVAAAKSMLAEHKPYAAMAV